TTQCRQLNSTTSNPAHFHPPPHPPPRAPLFPYTTLFRSTIPGTSTALGSPRFMPRLKNRYELASAVHTPAESTAASMSTGGRRRSEEHTSELQSRFDLVCRLLLENKSVGLLRYACGPSPRSRLSLTGGRSGC